MNPSPATSPDAVRTRRLALLAAAPLAVLAFAVYMFSGQHTDAAASAKPVLVWAAPPEATTPASQPAPVSVDEAPVPSPQDAELAAYHTHGG